jgi:hypothetical protein
MLWKSRWHVLARCGLLLTLIEASGVRETLPGLSLLVGLPLLDSLLNSGVYLGGQSQGYQGVQRSVRRAYQISVWGLLLLTGLRLTRTPWGVAGLGIVKVCEWDGSRVELEQWQTEAELPAYRVRLQGEFVLELRSQAPFA